MSRKLYSANRQGFSLIELIIVMAIAAVMIGGATLTIGALSGTNTKEFAYEINSALTELKAKNMSGAKSLYLHIYRYNDSFYLKYADSASIALDDTGKEIGSPSMKVNVTYDVQDNSNNKLPDELQTLSTGSDICIGITKKDGSYVYFPKTVGGTDKRAVREISVSSQSGSGYIVYMVTETGNHYVEVK